VEEPHARSAKKPAVTMTQVFLFLLAIVIAFIAGTRSDYIIATITGRTVGNVSLDLSSVQSLYKELSTSFDGELDNQKLVEGAKRGMVEAVGDPYTVYFTAKEAEEFLGELEGTFEGIGAELSRKEGVLTIVSTIDGSPAKKAGLQAGDSILMVNDKPTAEWSVEEAVKNIRGAKGTTVKLTVARLGQDKALEFSVVRDQITDPSVKTEITADNIGILRITRFGQSDTVQLARQAAREFRDKNVRGVVVDLRGNGGGYLESSRDIASLWLNNKVIVTERTGGVVIDTLYSRGEAILAGVPTVVMVNEGTASASEILAGALRDNGAAKLVGTKTYGKGVVQDVRSLSDGGSLKVTIASWYTPKGKNISKEGITPETVIDLTDEDVAAGRDPQKDKALELLK
jgi:carboxyl-terminal processing protease